MIAADFGFEQQFNSGASALADRVRSATVAIHTSRAGRAA